MKKILLISFIYFLNNQSGYSKPKNIITQKHNFSLTLRVKLKQQSDTLTVGQAFTNDQSFFSYKNYNSTIENLKYQIEYVKQQALINFFTPLFDTKICEPGDYTDPAYLAFKQNADKIVANLKSSILKLANSEPGTSTKLKKHIGGAAELNACKIQFIPIYYLTYNVVRYKKGENMIKYFNLDTSKIIFRVLKDNKLLALIRYQHGFSSILEVIGRDSINYNQVMTARQDPIGLEDNLLLPKYRSSSAISTFGYVFNNQLFYAFNSTQHGTSFYGDGSKKNMIIEKHRLRTVNDEFFDQNNFLLQRIQSEYKFLINNEHLAPLKP